jgi:hypothetical protein
VRTAATSSGGSATEKSAGWAATSRLIRARLRGAIEGQAAVALDHRENPVSGSGPDPVHRVPDQPLSKRWIIEWRPDEYIDVGEAF